MGRKKVLSNEEIGKIKAYKDCGLKISQISNKIGRTRCVVSNYLSNPSNYGKNMKGGTYTVLSVLQTPKTATKIKEKTGVKASLANIKACKTESY